MTTRPRAAALALAFASLAAADPALAADPAPGGLADLTGPRALALGGGAGVQSGTEGIFVNPGAIGARRRYAAEAFFALDRRSGLSDGRWVGGTVVDAISSAPVAVSAGYLRALDDQATGTGNVVTFGFSTPVANRVWLGGQGRWVDLKGGPERIGAVTADAGLYWEVSDLVTVGVAGYNLVPVGHERALPQGMGAGLSFGSDTSFKVTADWRGDFERAGKTTNRYGAGAELLLGRMFPVRAGWVKDETLGTSWWSAGLGVVSSGGMAIDAGYRQSLDASAARTIVLSLKIFVLEL